MKEKGVATEPSWVSIGPRRVRNDPHRASDGGRTGILVKPMASEHIGGTKILKGVVDAERGIVIMGKQAIDDDRHRPADAGGALPGWSQGTLRPKAGVEGDIISVTREVDGGLQTGSPRAAIVNTDRASQRAAHCAPSQQ